MLSQTEKHQLKQYCENDPQLALLIRRLEDAHHMELSRISHEIRNPVTLINSFLQMTQSHHPEVSSYQSWKPIIENMSYLRQLLDELSDYNNSMRLHKDQFSLTYFLEALVSECTPILHPIKISFRKTTAIPPACFDQVKLRAAVLNLIRNAAEALAGHPDGEILLSLSFDGSLFHISISNNGPEIPSEYLPSLFDPFITHKKEGTGLGLAIVQNIVQAHDGTVTVSSSQEETCFTLHIPLSYQ